MDITVWGAFIVGLMGAAHCFGMCGGLIGAFASSLPKTKQNHLAQQLSFLVTYNLGRMISYTLAGMIVGGGAAALNQLFVIDDYLIYLRFFVGIMMIITGLYISHIWLGLIHIEKLGQFFWQRLQPLTKKLLPINTQKQSFAAGLVWGWLPCGLVYSTLTWSVASGSAIQGGLIMFAFGLGTLPALLSAGLVANKLANFVQNKTVKLLSGLLIIAFGVQTIYVAIAQLN
ncbi:sulfite exporter TauE/SafE family protein [Shewanella intestini]|uniref:Sulfite exporter TauE/SafE family protein n=1 Tax=Shewanella intestini TaxID=2017544 RepID=A0ABS5I0B9_9GAMM|nr:MULTISPECIES: sulfite exporter TauE/SafE family protein [Shewanella]MBR9727278.1 sulfite exporter TauE/SafE family protein [Shewanella intestini]MRG36080.1 sulfite exporter TauE/SafE family protein [Shewanella sp. XMDDZSB0408]